MYGQVSPDKQTERKQEEKKDSGIQAANAEAAGLRPVQHDTCGDGNGKYNDPNAPDLKCIIEPPESYR